MFIHKIVRAHSIMKTLSRLIPRLAFKSFSLALTTNQTDNCSKQWPGRWPDFWIYFCKAEACYGLTRSASIPVTNWCHYKAKVSMSSMDNQTYSFLILHAEKFKSVVGWTWVDGQTFRPILFLYSKTVERFSYIGTVSNRKACNWERLSGKPRELTGSSGIVNRLSKWKSPDNRPQMQIY